MTYNRPIKGGESGMPMHDVIQGNIDPVKYILLGMPET